MEQHNKSGPTWSAQLTVSFTRDHRLPGDKICLPPSALEQLLAASASAAASSVGPAPSYDPWNTREYNSYHLNLEQQQQRLPHPLTFRLVNPSNGRVVYAGMQEFSAEDGQVVLSDTLRSTLGVNADQDDQPHAEVDGLKEQESITVHFRELPRGTYVKLRPLEPGYDVEDWKALLEQHMRTNYTTLTKGEVLEVPGGSTLGQPVARFRFLIDSFKPDADGICVVDTDLEVDIEALNEEQARETVRQIAAKYQNGTSNGATPIGDLHVFKETLGQVAPGSYVDYQLQSWPRDQTLTLALTPGDPGDDIDLLVSPFSSRQRSRPRADAYMFADWAGHPTKRIRLSSTNIEMEGADALYVSVYSFSAHGTDAGAHGRKGFTIRALVGDAASGQQTPPEEDRPPNDGDVRCKNCRQWVPSRSLILHENFCLRNNNLCPQGCGQVFQKRSEAFETHWHCPHDTMFGNGSLTKTKHDTLYHPSEPLQCSKCSTKETFTSIPLLAQHHVTVCPAKTILCRFCHLAVPQEGDPDEPNPEALLSGLTVHELQDGSRTTECHMCRKITRMRDMDTHLKHHDLQRKSRPRPRPCRNMNCGNTLDGANHAGNTRIGHDTGNDINLCKTCYGPLYVSLHDPEGKALKRRIERRYLQQLMTGCKRAWCQDEFCKTGRNNMQRPEEGTSAKTAIPLVKPYVDAAVSDTASPLHFCVDDASGQRRHKALLLEAESSQHLGARSYSFPWCLAATEAEAGDLAKARTWLGNYAPRIDEERL